MASHLLGESTGVEVVVLSWEGFPRVIGDNSKIIAPKAGYGRSSRRGH